VSRRLVILNVLVGTLGCLFAAGLIRELGTGRPLPPMPAIRAGQSAPEPRTQPAGQPATMVTYGTIATRNLFSPGRSEAPVATPATLAARPVLHGVKLDGANSRAYLEEPPAKRVFGYAVGDAIAGGRLDSIGPDRVVIARPEGLVEVLLHDPSKPKPVAPAAAIPAGQRVRTEPSRPPGAAQSQTPRPAPPQ
jgi:hypothetical protein